MLPRPKVFIVFVAWAAACGLMLVLWQDPSALPAQQQHLSAPTPSRARSQRLRTHVSNPLYLQVRGSDRTEKYPTYRRDGGAGARAAKSRDDEGSIRRDQGAPDDLEDQGLAQSYDETEVEEAEEGDDLPPESPLEEDEEDEDVEDEGEAKGGEDEYSYYAEGKGGGGGPAEERGRRG
ncbi:myelin transcription factor 1-like protein isoform X2 [Penaeus japonicus]|uniref:myelin transcription factor 1-like protein isoform X2 n=1 Tax=Penaeus japonicus TaxID=27405 RepID=UPI001C716B40|nr:myelin transcription factor 1-like protein isoform X2 [Penaeus japonicus]